MSQWILDLDEYSWTSSGTDDISYPLVRKLRSPALHINFNCKLITFSSPKSTLVAQNDGQTDIKPNYYDNELKAERVTGE